MFLPFCIYQRTSASQVASAPPSYIPNALLENKKTKNKYKYKLPENKKYKYKLPEKKKTNANTIPIYNPKIKIEIQYKYKPNARMGKLTKIVKD